MLFKKLIRTAWKYKAQFISMIAMVAIGVGIFVGFNMEWNSIEYNTNKYFEETKLSDYKITSESVLGFSESDIEKIKEISGVEAASRTLEVDMSVNGEGDLSGDSLSVNVIEDYGGVSAFIVRSGKAYPSADEMTDKSSYGGIWLSESYAESNGLKLGDTLKLSYKGYTIEGEIKGLVMAGEHMICVSGSNQLMPDYTRYGYCYITPALLKDVLKIEYYPQINILSSLSKADMESGVNTAFGKTTMLLTRNENTSYAGAQSEAEEGKTMGNALPVLFLLIGVLTMITTMHRITVNEKTQIGTLKALGFKDRTILWHYTAYGLFIGIVGSIIGIALGYGIAAMVMCEGGMMSTYFDIPYHSLVMYWYYWLIIVAINGLLTLISYLSVRKMLVGTAADALRPYTPKRMKKTALEKTKLWEKLPFGTKWNTRDLFRHKTRSLMTLIGVLGCTLLMVGGMGMADTMQAFLGDLQTTSNYATRINLAEDITYDYALTLSDKYSGDWVSTTGVKLDEKTVTMEIYDVERGKVLFSDRKYNVVTLSDDGAYICERIANLGYSAGDTLTVSPYGTDDKYTLKVAGVLHSVTENIVMTESYAKSVGVKDYTVTAIFTDTVYSQVENDTYIAGTQSISDILASYDTFMEIMNLMVVILVVAAALLGLIVLYTLGTMSYVERYREMATLKVVGFKDKHIGRLLIGQNIFITVIGILIGLPAGYGALYALVMMLTSEYELKVAIGAGTFILSTVLTFGVSLLVGLLVSRKNKKINMVESLKCAE